MLGALWLTMQSPDFEFAHAEVKLRDTIERVYRAPDGVHYLENAGKPEIAFLWAQGVMMGALAQGLHVDRATYLPLWLKSREALDTYWNDHGYAVLPNGWSSERYYDDNAWIAWACLEAYEVTLDKEDLERAIKAYGFAVSGYDQKLGGGVYWREEPKSEKNACSTAPTAAVAMKLANLFPHRKDWLSFAYDNFYWLFGKLRDQDLLIWDHISLEGKVDRKKWSYNSACFIRGCNMALEHNKRWSDLYNVQHPGEGIAIDFDDTIPAFPAIALPAAVKEWVDPKTHLLHDPAPFGQHLLDAMFETDQFKIRYQDEAVEVVRSILANCPDENGLYGEYWDRKPKPGEPRNLKNIAATLRVVLSARRYLQGR